MTLEDVIQAQRASDGEASFSAWQLQDAPTPAPCDGMPAQSGPSSSSLSLSPSSLRTDLSTGILGSSQSDMLTDSSTGILGSSQSNMAVNEVDALLNGGSPATETCSRRKPKTAILPRIKSTRCRRTKQKTPCLRQPLPDAAFTFPATRVSDAHVHTYHPLQDVEGQPCGGLWQKLGSSLSAVWRWLCKSGSNLLKLGRKLHKKLLAALGLGQEEAQRLLTQQAEAQEPLLVRSHTPVQPLQPQGPTEPWGHPRLQRWRM